jgi:flagella basal body P-ring formation protein FlgA
MRCFVRHVPLLLLAITAGVPAQAATLRPLTLLNAPVVRLSDLFDDAGPRADRVLGPGPAPGERIVVEAAQLAAIARQFGVDWRPASAADRAVLDRPGKLLRRDSITSALLAALARVGAPAEVEIELPGFEPPLVPTEATPDVTVEQVDYEGATGRFTAAVLVSGAAMEPLRLRLSGQLDEIAHVLVPTHRLAAGSVLRAGDLAPATTRAAALRGEVAREPAQALGMALRHAVAAGQPLPLAELQRPLAVAKGAHVTMELRMPGLTVLAQGTALADGALGERIAVLNPVSRLEVEGEIVGPDHVRVAPDSVPVPSSGAASAQASAP